MRQLSLLIGTLVLLFFFNAGTTAELSGHVGLEARYFAHAPLFAEQKHHNASINIEPEIAHQWDDGRQSLVFTPFARLDNVDTKRSHFDIRELLWTKAADEWELQVGIGKVFWGVTESQHLVDIINQTDFVENTDGEDKLGQPMVNLTWIKDWGTLNFFVLPSFRERTFPGNKGRLRPSIPVDHAHAIYQSSQKERHIDWAARWFHSIGDWDIGLSHFSGTSRDPQFQPSEDSQHLQAVYHQISQTGLDVQAIIGDWLVKLELISRQLPGKQYTAFTTGFEYTLVGIFQSDADLGVIAEYSFDDRGNKNPFRSAFQNDLMAGMRLVLNDIQSSEILFGGIFDLDDEAVLYTLEGSRRLGEAWKLTVETRIFSNITKTTDPLYSLRSDDHLLINLAWFF